MNFVPLILLDIPQHRKSQNRIFFAVSPVFSPTNFRAIFWKKARMKIDTESCPSGRRCSTRNAVDRKVSRVRIPNSPPQKACKQARLQAFFLCLFLRVSDQSRLLFFSPDFRLSPFSVCARIELTISVSKYKNCFIFRYTLFI